MRNEERKDRIWDAEEKEMLAIVEEEKIMALENCECLRLKL